MLGAFGTPSIESDKPDFNPGFKPSNLKLAEDFHQNVKGEGISLEEHLFLGVLLEFLKGKNDWNQKVCFNEISYPHSNKNSRTCKIFFKFMISPANSDLRYSPFAFAMKNGFVVQANLWQPGEYYVTQKFIDYVSKNIFIIQLRGTK